MTIERTTSSVSYTGNGATTAFDFAFPIPSGGLRVLQRLNGVESIVSPSAYTVSGLNNANGGKVTFASAPASGTGITIARYLSLTQSTSFATGQAFYPEVVETALDRQTMLTQQLDEALSRAPKLPQSYTVPVDLTLPLPVAGKGLMWNQTANGLKTSDADLDVLAVQAPQAIAAGAAATAAASSATTSATSAANSLTQAQAVLSTLQQQAATAELSIAQSLLATQTAQAKTETALSGAEQARHQAEILNINTQSTVTAAIQTATASAQTAATAMVQAAQSAQDAAVSAANAAAGSASAVTVQQAVLDQAVAAAQAAATTAANAAAQANSMAYLLQTTDYGFIGDPVSYVYDYGVLP